MALMTIKIIFKNLSIVCFLDAAQLFSGSQPVVERFEQIMQKSGRLWLQEQYFSAMDGFQEARTLLDGNLPVPAHEFN